MALSIKEAQLAERLEKKLRSLGRRNANLYNYYYGKLKVKDLGVSTPPRLKGLNTVLGWGSSAVDVLQERIKFTGFYSPTTGTDIEALNELYRENFLDVNQRGVAKDAFITGASYISVGVGDTLSDESEILYRGESPNNVYGEYNIRTMRLNNCIKIIRQGDTDHAILWLPDVTITMIRDKSSKGWFEVERDEHELGFVSVVANVNNADTMYPRGITEITPALRGHIDSGMRTLLGAELAREFFAMPLRSIVGADKNDFMDADGQPLDTWNLITGRVINIPYNNIDAITPQILQLPASNPENIMNLIEPLARLAAREIGVPPSFFGFETVNPSSADAINEADKKLINKAYTRIPEQKKAWKQAFAYGEIMRNGRLPENWVNVEPVFERPETPTPSAAADRVTKMISSGVFNQPLPDFVYRELGFKELDILQLKQFLSAQQGNNLLNSLLTQNTGNVTDAGAANGGV